MWRQNRPEGLNGVGLFWTFLGELLVLPLILKVYQCKSNFILVAHVHKPGTLR